MNSFKSDMLITTFSSAFFLYCCILISRADAAHIAESKDIVSKDSVYSEPQILQARISNDAQFVQHPQGGQSFYLPPNLKIDHATQPQAQEEQNEVIQLQLPTNRDTNKILLHLPQTQTQSQLQSQSQYSAPPPYPYRLPPRKHYKITVIRSPTPATTSPPPTPEIEEKTLIYVLVKKPDDPTPAQVEEIQKAQQAAIKFNEPEVYFIKYKANSKEVETIAAGNVATAHEQHQAIGQLHSTDSVGQIVQSQARPEAAAATGGYSYAGTSH